MKAIVTGANRGIGLEYCRQLKERSYEVTALCRKPSAELEQLGINIQSDVDVTDIDALKKAAAGFSPASVDLLINNAGIMKRNNIAELDYASIKQQFEVNAMGPLMVVDAFLPVLKPQSKIALMTSRMGSIEDNTSGSSYGYRMSKAALNMAGVSLAQDLKDKQISVAILHPGFVRTDMTSGNGNIDPDESVRGLLQRIDELNLNNSGTFRHSNGEILPW